MQQAQFPRRGGDHPNPFRVAPSSSAGLELADDAWLGVFPI
jgi:hypothetical protein